MTADSTQWRILLTGSHDAYWNMALDEVLFRTFLVGNRSPIFRVYEWNNPAITVGYGQRAANMLDLDACMTDNIEVTRRMTGGRAVFHTNEIGYTVIGHTDDPVFGGGIRDTYRTINKVIVAAYQSLGIDAAESEICTLTDMPARMRRQAPCFTLPTPFELVGNGVKLAGGAQRRINGSFLQQGTIRLGPGEERIIDYLADRGAAAVFHRIIEPDAANCMNLSTSSMKDAFVRSFSQVVDGAAEDIIPTECGEAERLSHKRYRAKGWIDGTGCEPDL